MRMRKKMMALLLAGAVTGTLAACGGPGGGESGGSPAPGGDDGNGAVYVVGISQLVTHEALDAATRGFQDALNELLPGQVTFDVQNAANDPAACASIATSFVSKGVDLIMANATPALQAAAAATADIPILGASVTEYGASASLCQM